MQDWQNGKVALNFTEKIKFTHRCNKNIGKGRAIKKARLVRAFEVFGVTVDSAHQVIKLD
jgi:hypothetical protein